MITSPLRGASQTDSEFSLCLSLFALGNQVTLSGLHTNPITILCPPTRPGSQFFLAVYWLAEGREKRIIWKSVLLKKHIIGKAYY